jgi:hypothetical protein
LNDEELTSDTSAARNDPESRLSLLTRDIALALGRWYGTEVEELNEPNLQRHRGRLHSISIKVKAADWRGRVIVFRGPIDLADLDKERRRDKIGVPMSLIVICGSNVTHAAITYARANFIRLFRFAEHEASGKKKEVAWNRYQYSFTLAAAYVSVVNSSHVTDFNVEPTQVLVHRPAEMPATLHQVLGELVNESDLPLSLDPAGLTVEFDPGTLAVKLNSDEDPVGLIEAHVVAMRKSSKVSHLIDTSHALSFRLFSLDGSSPHLDVTRSNLVEPALDRDGAICMTCWNSFSASTTVAMPMIARFAERNLLSVTPAPAVTEDFVLVCPNCASSLRNADADAMKRRALDASIPILNIDMFEAPRIVRYLESLHHAIQPKLPLSSIFNKEPSSVDQLESALREIIEQSSSRQVIDLLRPALDLEGGVAYVRFALESPFKQYSYAIGLLAATNEPDAPCDLDATRRWRIRFLLHSIVQAYVRDYGPVQTTQFSSIQDEMKTVVLISAFLDSYCSLAAVSGQAAVERLLNLALFHPEALPELIGLSLVELLSCTLFDLRRQPLRFLDAEVTLTWAIALANERATAQQYHRLWDSPQQGRLRDVEVSDAAWQRYRNLFGIRRGEHPDFKSFGTEGPAETRPLFILNDNSHVSSGQLLVFDAIERVVDECFRNRFAKYRDRRGDLLEYQVRRALRSMYPSEAITEHVFLERGSYERDFLVISGNVVLCIEAKAVQRKVQPVTFREALNSLQKNFREGPEHALKQAQDHAIALEEHRKFGRPLYDANSARLESITLPANPTYVHVAVMADDYGILAERPYLVGRQIPPMSVIISGNDLEFLVDGFSFTGLCGHDFARFLADRAHYTHLASAESIKDWAAAWIERGGTYDGFLEEGSIRGLEGGDTYFTKIFKAVFQGDDPANVTHSVEDIRDTDRFKWGPRWWKPAKLAASDPCFCGSGRRADECHRVFDLP